jgi:glycine cleavage system H lipoate-binding protein
MTMEPLQHDPFATKGVEYLIVLAFLVLLPFYSRYLNGRPSTAPSRVLAALRRLAGRWIRLPEVATFRPGWTQYLGGPHPARAGRGRAARERALSGWFRLPEAAYYHEGHTWAVPAGQDRVRIGVDDFAQKILGAARAIAVPEVGASLAKGEPGWALDVDEHRFDLPAPLTGRVVARNEAVLGNPGLVLEDPYERGWILELEVPKLRRSLRELLHGDRAREWLARAEEALRLRMSPEVGAVLQDGGVPVPGIARALSSENWDRLARDLLSRT